MLNTLSINLKTDIKTDRPTTLPITLMSQDKNNNQFILRFTNGGEAVALDDTYTVEILTKFSKSGTSRLTSATVRQDYATWEFDTAYITQDETVYNYVYVRKAGNLVVSADANCFVFNVDLSEIDKGAGKVAEVYDENYEKVLADYSGALDERTTERLDEAVADFNQRGDADIADWRDENSAELLNLQTEIAKKANRKQEEWLTPTLVNGWVNFNISSFPPASFYKSEVGKVEMQGLVTGGASSTFAFVLPTGYRPSKVLHLQAMQTNGVSTYITVSSNGNVSIFFSGTPTYVSLTGISFRAEA